MLGNFFCNLSFQNPVSCISSTTAETKNYYWLKVNCLLAVVLHLWDSWAYHKNKALKCLFSFPSYFPISNNKMKRFFTLFFKQKISHFGGSQESTSQQRFLKTHYQQFPMIPWMISSGLGFRKTSHLILFLVIISPARIHNNSFGFVLSSVSDEFFGGNESSINFTLHYMNRR